MPDLTPVPTGTDTAADGGTPFVRVIADRDNHRAVIALDAAAIDELLRYLDDIGPYYDLRMNPGSYGLDDPTANSVADVVGRISGPLNKLRGYL